MALPQGINFRQGSGFVTDAADEDVEIAQGTNNYPRTTAQGNNVGWESGAANVATRDRNSGIDRRIAGIAFTFSATSVYRIDLPSAGSYNVGLGAGDDGNAQDVNVDLYDSTTSLGSLSTGTIALATFNDATNTNYSETNWPGSQTRVAKSFASTICRFKLNPAASGTLNVLTHVYIAAAASIATVAWTPPSSFHPGRSPGRAQRFYQSPKATNTSSVGVLAGIDGLTFGQTGILTGVGALTGSTSLTFGQTGAMTATGTLAGSSALVFGQTGTLGSPGVLAGTSALTFAQTGAIVGTGALSGSSALAFATTGVLTGSGLLSGLSALVFGASGTADLPPGALVGTTAITLAASGTLTASGTLAGIASMLFDAFGTLPVSGQAGATDSQRSAEGWYRRKKRKQLKSIESKEPVFASFAPPQAVIDTVPDFTTLAQTLGESPAALSAKVDHEIEMLMRAEAERDDEEALTWILRALD